MDLDADKQAFVDAVMEPLGDDAARRDLLEECLGVAETYPRLVEGDSVEVATRRMQKTAGSFKRRCRLGLVLPGLLTLVGAWFCVLGPPAWKSLDQVLLTNRMNAGWSAMCCTHEGVPDFPRFGKGHQRYEDEPTLRRFIRRMDPEKRLLLLGDLDAATEGARWKAVWDRHPEEPAHFLAYAIKYWKIHSAWPPDLVETGEKLDPGNGWFRVLAATEKIKSSIGEPPPPRLTREERRAQAGKPYVPPPKPVRAVLNPGLFAEGHAMLEQALAMPRWDSYSAKLERIRFEATDVPADFADFSAGQVIGIQQPEDWSEGWGQLFQYREAFSFAAAQAAKDGDRERLDRLGQILKQMGQRLADMPAGYFPRITARHIQIGGCDAVAKGWKTLGEPDKAKPFENLVRDLDPKRRRLPTPPPDALDEHRGSGFVLKTYKGSREPHASAVTEEELRGGRLAEYALYERFIVHVGEAFLFLVAVVLVIAIRRDREMLGVLPSRLADLLRPSDRFVILGIGFLLPLTFYLLSTRVGWIVPRDKGLSQQRFILWLLQVVSLGVSVILLTLRVARQRLDRRGTMLAMEIRGANPMKWMGTLALALMPAAAILPKLMEAGDFATMLCWTFAGFMAGMPLLWLLNIAAYQFAGQPARRLHRAVLLRCILLPLAMLMALGAVSIPLLHAEERYWVDRLDYERPAPGIAVMSTRAEWEEADWINEETKKALKSLK